MVDGLSRDASACGGIDWLYYYFGIIGSVLLPFRCGFLLSSLQFFGYCHLHSGLESAPLAGEPAASFS